MSKSLCEERKEVFDAADDSKVKEAGLSDPSANWDLFKIGLWSSFGHVSSQRS